MRVPVHFAWRRVLLVLCASAGCLWLWSAPALGAALPVVGEEWVTNVASGSATLQAQVNPEGSETSYRFEYGTSESYGASIPVPDGVIASGTSAVSVLAHPQNLLANTTYHFRVVATSPGGTIDGVDHVFTTQAAGGALTLLDGRAWELVSPPNKHGAGLETMNDGGPIQASADGGAITYLATGTVTGEPAGNRGPEWLQVFSHRVPGGWGTQDISTPHDATAPLALGEGPEYRFFSADLSLGLLEPRAPMPLSPEATERTPYLRDDTAGSYLPLVTAANVLPGTKFGGDPGNLTSGAAFVASGTLDLKHVLLSSSVPLTANAVGGGLYEWTGGKLQLVSVLPGPAETPAGEYPFIFLGDQQDVRNAISADGSRIVWETASVDEGNHLYLRDLPRGETVQISAVQAGASGEGEERPVFQTASSDGSKIFFTDTQKLTVDSAAGYQVPDLYEFDVSAGIGKLAGTLTDVTVDHNPGEHAEAQGGVLGASEDGSYVYFVANGVLASGATLGHCLAPGNPPPGATCNLYVRHGGTTTFIAALSLEDVLWRFDSDLYSLLARVSPSGRFLAFMSNRSLTGYDNRDAVSGERDEEVYLYDALSGRLVCASCNPTGARPVGVYDSGEFPELLVDHPGVLEHRWLAGSVPGWTRVSIGMSLYQSRYLSDSGRLFFNSPDALVPQDVNGLEDVYEYEPEGVGDCHRAGGCVGLVSSGSSREESVFLDASETGGDVFFLTSAQLVAQDYDHALDVYDAHVCSALVPCTSAAVSPPACTTADSCKAAVSPQPTVFGAPASATFAGAGNPAPGASKPALKSRKPKHGGRHRKHRKRGASAHRRAGRSRAGKGRR